MRAGYMTAHVHHRCQRNTDDEWGERAGWTRQGDRAQEDERADELGQEPCPHRGQVSSRRSSHWFPAIGPVPCYLGAMTPSGDSFGRPASCSAWSEASQRRITPTRAESDQTSNKPGKPKPTANAFVKAR